jgi:hypothetical protein
MLFADILEDAGNFMMQWYILVPMIVVLLGLIGLMVFMRMRKKDDDE